MGQSKELGPDKSDYLSQIKSLNPIGRKQPNFYDVNLTQTVGELKILAGKTT